MTYQNVSLTLLIVDGVVQTGMLCVLLSRILNSFSKRNATLLSYHRPSVDAFEKLCLRRFNFGLALGYRSIQNLRERHSCTASNTYMQM